MKSSLGLQMTIPGNKKQEGVKHISFTDIPNGAIHLQKSLVAFGFETELLCVMIKCPSL